jgi:hypothetical protein
MTINQTYVGRVENQLIGADVLDVRATVDAAYEKIVQTMFESLKQMAKIEGEGEDKGQLNYHVELVGESFCLLARVFKRLTNDPQRTCNTSSPKSLNRKWGL